MFKAVIPKVLGCEAILAVREALRICETIKSVLYKTNNVEHVYCEGQLKDSMTEYPEALYNGTEFNSSLFSVVSFGGK
jgi:hypothetical protein